MLRHFRPAVNSSCKLQPMLRLVAWISPAWPAAIMQLHSGIAQHPGNAKMCQSRTERTDNDLCRLVAHGEPADHDSVPGLDQATRAEAPQLRRSRRAILIPLIRICPTALLLASIATGAPARSNNTASDSPGTCAGSQLLAVLKSPPAGPTARRE